MQSDSTPLTAGHRFYSAGAAGPAAFSCWTVLSEPGQDLGPLVGSLTLRNQAVLADDISTGRECANPAAASAAVARRPENRGLPFYALLAAKAPDYLQSGFELCVAIRLRKVLGIVFKNLTRSRIPECLGAPAALAATGCSWRCPVAGRRV